MVNDTVQVVTIAGTDSSGGAGIQADLATFFARHVYGAAIQIAATAQNTRDVEASLPFPLPFIDQQFQAIATDLHIRAAKTGMLFDGEHVQQVAQNLTQVDFGPLVIDPVMIAKGGHALLQPDGIDAMKTSLLPLATVITPNLPEAEVLTGITIQTDADVLRAATTIQLLGVPNVIIKGGHGQGAVTHDFVLLSDQQFWLDAPRIDTANTHGTGDTFSAAITAELAKGAELKTAIILAKMYIQGAIADGIAVGHGHGPTNHWALPVSAIQVREA